MGEHATEGRDFDESLRGLGQALMVASEATPSGDPGQAAFHHPPVRQDGKASLGPLGRWLGVDQVLIASGAQTPHALNVPPQMLFDPIKELSPVMTIAPDELHPGKAITQELTQLLASGQVG